MFFPDHKLILVHVPKTAGNFLARALAAYSPDRLRASGNRDGVERFTVVGPVTKTKHQTLAAYHTRMGARLQKFDVLAVARRPRERLLSMYFSPHRWMRESDAGGYEVAPTSEITFDEEQFCAMVASVPTTGHYLDQDALSEPLSLDRPIRHASGARLHLWAYGDMGAMLTRLGTTFGLPSIGMPVPVNQSAHAPLKAQVLAERADRISQIIQDSAHADDEALFKESPSI